MNGGRALEKESENEWSDLNRHLGKKAGWISYFSVVGIKYPDKRTS